ncbi:MAG TPA: hypothetical protein PL011_06940 [Kiritimatiellia bacterium]|nr:hypothetical protein [Kiritimatiellia bacterium]HRX07321.1 hypothetical protein [Kiritimatiellia bacterium]
MKFKLPALSSLFWPGILFVAFSFLVAGCEPDGYFAGDDSQSSVSMAELNGIQPDPEPEPVETSTETDPSDSAEPSQAPEPSPTPDPTPPPTTSSSGFLWQPRADSIRVVIPASLPHWRFWVFSRRKHFVLHGPVDVANNRYEDVEYILNGNGASWRQKSSAAGDDGTLLIMVNTKELQFTGYRNAGWRIMTPEAAQSGDGDRLQIGQDR